MHTFTQWNQDGGWVYDKTDPIPAVFMHGSAIALLADGVPFATFYVDNTVSNFPTGTADGNQNMIHLKGLSQYGLLPNVLTGDITYQTIKQGQPSVVHIPAPNTGQNGYLYYQNDGLLYWRISVGNGSVPTNLIEPTQGGPGPGVTSNHGWTVDLSGYPDTAVVTSPADATLTQPGVCDYFLSVMRNPPGFSSLQWGKFDIVAPCQPVSNLVGLLRGNTVTLTFDNPNGSSDVYRTYYDANGDFVRNELAMAGVVGGQFSETVGLQAFDGAGNHPVITYQVISRCGADASNPAELPPDTDFPITYDHVKANSLRPITSLRHYRLRR